MGVSGPRTGPRARDPGHGRPLSSRATPAALATSWALLLIVAGAALLVSDGGRAGVGHATAVVAAAAFAGLYCAVIGAVAHGHGAPAAAALGVLGVAFLTVLFALGDRGESALAPARPELALAPPPTKVAPPPPTKVSPPPAPHPIASPEAVVRAYYRALDAHRFAVAWRRLSPAVRAGFGGFTAWRAGYGTTLSSRPAALAVVARAPGSVRLRLRLDAVDRVSGGTRRASFTVEWQLARTAAGWRATSLTARAGA